MKAAATVEGCPVKALPKSCTHQMLVSKATSLQHDIVKALVNRSFGQLRGLAKRGLLLPVARESLLATGLSLLFLDQSLLAPRTGRPE